MKWFILIALEVDIYVIIKEPIESVCKEKRN